MKTLVRNLKGFTLIELVMVTLLLGILAAVAIPEFIDFRTEARNNATKGALGGLRSAISIARAAIALKEDTSTPDVPSLTEMQKNAYDTSHPVLSGNKIMDPSGGVPDNPWTVATASALEFRSFFDCGSQTKGWVASIAAEKDKGWCYDKSDGEVWANSRLNGSSPTENTY